MADDISFDFDIGPGGSPDDFRAAASSGDLKRVEALKLAVSFIDCSDAEGRSALYCAAENGHVEVCQSLLGAGASPNGPLKKSGPLHAAAAAGHVKVVKLLLAAGADSSRPDGSGQTAGHLATLGGHTDCIAAINKAANE